MPAAGERAAMRSSTNRDTRPVEAAPRHSGDASRPRCLQRRTCRMQSNPPNPAHCKERHAKSSYRLHETLVMGGAMTALATAHDSYQIESLTNRAQLTRSSHWWMAAILTAHILTEFSRTIQQKKSRNYPPAQLAAPLLCSLVYLRRTKRRLRPLQSALPVLQKSDSSRGGDLSAASLL